MKIVDDCKPSNLLEASGAGVFLSFTDFFKKLHLLQILAGIKKPESQ